MATIFRLVVLGGLSLVLFAGCASRITDGVPTTITPNVVRVKVNDVVSVNVFLSQPRKSAGTLTLNVGSPEFVRPASNENSVQVQVGQDAVQFRLQGVKGGESLVFATLDGYRVQARVVVTNQ